MPTTPPPSPKDYPPLAPDGLPWPPGYFDVNPKMTFEKALAKYGVRPNHYFKGRPVYTQAERDNPACKITVPPEPGNSEARWRGARDDGGILRGSKQPPAWAPFEVRLVTLRFGKKDYCRPCIVVNVEDSLYARVLILSSTDTSTPDSPQLEIDESHPDFAATGLERTCYTLEPVQMVLQS